MDNIEKLANIYFFQTLENTEGAIKNGQSRETGSKGYTRRRKINVREYRKGKQKWTIQRNWQQRVHKTKENKRQRIPKGHTNMDNLEKLATYDAQDVEKRSKNMCDVWTSLCTSKHN